MRVKVFDIVSVLMDELEEKDMKYRNLSKEKMDALRNACNNLDTAAERFEATSVSADYDSSADTFVIAMSSSDVMTRFSESPDFFDLLDHAISFQIERENADSICCMFTFEAPWNL